MAQHKFGYLDLNDIQGGWAELFQSIPDWITELRKDMYEPLDKKEEAKLFAFYHDGISVGAHVKEAIIRANMRFVTNIARHYLHNEIPPMELISAGNEALVHAFNKFDHTRDVKFITYAVNLVRASMIDVLRDMSVIRLSKASLQLLNDYILIGDIDEMREVFPDRYPDPLDKLEDKLDSFLTIKYLTSLDEEVSEGYTHAEGLQHKDDYNFTFADEIRMLIKGANLEPMEQAVIHLNFGLKGEKPLGLRNIATQLGSNLTKIQKIRKAAFAKLSTNERLKDILEEINESDAISWASPKTFNTE